MTTLNAEQVKHAAQTRLLGSVVHYWEQVDSTNAAIARLLKEGASEGTVVIADAQTIGKGRAGKTWFSPPGLNLHISVLLKPAIATTDAHFYTLIGSLAIADACESYNVKTQVKWPNDVLVNDKKIGGVLAELHASGARVDSLILGMGINVNISRNTMDHLYADAATGATSLHEALGHTIDRNALAARLLEHLERRHFLFLEYGSQPLLEEWRSRSFLGRRVAINEAGYHLEGIATNLDANGFLVVTLDDGSTVHVREGEVLPV
jgi:BirA family biotin operon repressor/biotin-[acetyl-CoA-carboxylase] ligase